MFGPQINGLAATESNLFAGGLFSMAGPLTVNGVAKWDGSSWSGLGSGIDGQVWAVTASSSNFYAGGSFKSAGGSPATNVAMWNGLEWSALGSGVDFLVNALTVLG